MGMKGPGGPMAPMTFVPEGDPSMAGVSSGPLALEGGEGEMAEETGEGFSGDPSDFADDAGAKRHIISTTNLWFGYLYLRDLQEFRGNEFPWSRRTNAR